MTAAAPQLFLYCPLYGVAFDSADAGELARGVAVRVPSAEEWRTLYKKDVWRALPGGEGARSCRGPRGHPQGLRGAVRALARLTGRVDAEAVLDAVFGEFCIGK